MSTLTKTYSSKQDALRALAKFNHSSDYSLAKRSLLSDDPADLSFCCFAIKTCPSSPDSHLLLDILKTYVEENSDDATLRDYNDLMADLPY